MWVHMGHMTHVHVRGVLCCSLCLKGFLCYFEIDWHLWFILASFFVLGINLHAHVHVYVYTCFSMLAWFLCLSFFTPKIIEPTLYTHFRDAWHCYSRLLVCMALLAWFILYTMSCYIIMCVAGATSEDGSAHAAVEDTTSGSEASDTGRTTQETARQSNNV